MRVELSQRNLTLPLGALWLVALGFGFLGVFQRLTSGHEGAGYTSYIPWGLWVAAYVYFVGLSAGAFLISALIYVFGMRRLERIGKLALFTALVSLIAALLIIWFDIGHMERFLKVYFDGNPLSMMAWMVWLYTAYSVLLVVEFWFAMRADLEAWAREPGLRGRFAHLLLLRPQQAFGVQPLRLVSAYDPRSDRQVVRILGAIGVPLAIAFHGGVGALFGVVGARGFWNAPLYPILFITGALLSGGGLLTFIVAFFWPDRGSKEHRDTVSFLGQMTLGLLATYLILVWAEFSITWYADIPAEAEPLYQVLGGPYPWVFWVFQVALGAVIPIAMLMARPRAIYWVGAATFLVAISFLATRLNVVIPGLVTPQIEGLDTAYFDARLSFHYFPSVMEWLVLIFSGAFAVGLFYAGLRALPLTGKREGVSS